MRKDSYQETDVNVEVVIMVVVQLFLTCILGNMIDYLRESYGLNHVVTVSDDHSRHDVTYAHHDCNQIVRRLGRLFYWGKT